MAVIAGLSLPVLLRAKNEFALAADSLPSRKSAMWDLYSFLASAKCPKPANPSLLPAEMVCKRLPENGAWSWWAGGYTTLRRREAITTCDYAWVLEQSFLEPLEHPKKLESMVTTLPATEPCTGRKTLTKSG